MVVNDIIGLPPNPTEYIYGLGTPGLLQPGESIDCIAGYSVDPALAGMVEVTWETRASNFQGTDPDTTNNFVTTTFGVATALAVPATSFGALIALVLTIVVIGMRVMKRSKNA